MARSSSLRNPHLEGEPFFWEGAGPSPTGVLLVHGYTATPAEVRPLAQVLHRAGYTVAGPLLPGHLTTPEDLNRRTWQEWTATVEQAYQELRPRCGRVVVGGESLGSLLALYLASDHPEVAAVLSFATALEAPRYLAVLARLLAPVLPIAPKIGRPTGADDRWQGYPVYPVHAGLQVLKLQAEVRRRLPLIRQPLLVVHGRLDLAVRPEGMQSVYNTVGSSIKERHWCDQSNHCVLLDLDRDEVMRATLRFLDRVLGERPAGE